MQSRRGKDGKVLAPNWVHSELAKLVNELDGRHDAAMVAVVGLFGEDGFCVQSREQTTIFDPNEYGPLLLTGHRIVSSQGLAQVMTTAYNALQHEAHPIHEIEDNADKLHQLRAVFDQEVRLWLQEVILHAGKAFQQDKPSNLAVAAGSQVLGLWQQVAASTIQFKARNPENPEPPENSADQGGDGA